MKKFTTIILLLVFLIPQYSYARDYCESIFDENANPQELSQDQVNETILALMDTNDEIMVTSIPKNPDSPLCYIALSTMVETILDTEKTPEEKISTFILGWIIYSIWCWPFGGY